MHEKLNQFVKNDVWELVPRLEKFISLAPNGSSEIIPMKMERLSRINLD